MAHTPPIKVDALAVITLGPLVAREPTPIYEALVDELDLDPAAMPGVPLPLPTFDVAP